MHAASVNAHGKILGVAVASEQMEAKGCDFIVFFEELIENLAADGEDVARTERGDWCNNIVSLRLSERLEKEIAVNLGPHFVGEQKEEGWYIGHTG